MRSNGWFRAGLAGIALLLSSLVPWRAHALDVLEVASVGNANPVAWPDLIATQQGMFAAEGLDVKLVFVSSSAQLIQQVTAGSVNIGFAIGLVDPVRAVQQGASIALARIEGQAAPFALVGKPSIKKISELKGKTIMIGGAKDITRFYLDRMLIANGLKDSDCDLIFSGATPARYAALKSGAVDAAMLFPPFNLFALDDGFTDLGLVVDYAPNLPFSGTVMNRSWATANHDLAERYLRAINQAMVWFNTDANRDKAIDILVNAMHAKKADLTKTYDFFRKINFFESTGKVSRVKVNEIVNMLKSVGDIPQDFDANKLMLPSLVPMSD